MFYLKCLALCFVTMKELTFGRGAVAVFPPHQNITFPLILFNVASVAFRTCVNGRGLFTEIDDLAGAC